MKLRIVITVFISMLIVCPIFTKAETIVNNNGIEFSEEEYAKLSRVYSHASIMVMTEEKYNKLQEYDFDNITKKTMYVETKYNQGLNLTTEKILSEEEYQNYNAVAPCLNDGNVSYSSTAKKIDMAFISGSLWNYVVATATWKIIPKTRSFDVFGMRGEDFEFRDGSQEGEQVYIENGNYNVINYSWNGTNIKRFDDGFGISMNIVNNTITDLQTSVECDVRPTDEYPAIYSSYQHAVASVTLEQSHNYTLGRAGLGNVFKYPYSISSKYDGMSGIWLQF